MKAGASGLGLTAGETAPIEETMNYKHLEFRCPNCTKYKPLFAFGGRFVPVKKGSKIMRWIKQSWCRACRIKSGRWSKGREQVAQQ